MTRVLEVKIQGVFSSIREFFQLGQRRSYD